MESSAAITLVLGGARSGKSAVAERMVASSGLPVTYVATGSAPTDIDAAWSQRVAAHQARRPPEWPTVEVGPGGNLAGALTEIDGLALVDSLGTWLAGVEGFSPNSSVLIEALVARRSAGMSTVVVSEEVGLGVHPSTPVGGAFRDALGYLNRVVADLGDPVLLVVAGRVLELPACVAPEVAPDVAPGTH